MTKSEALQSIKALLEESLDYFEYFDTNKDVDANADIYWDIKHVISTVEKRILFLE